MTTAWIQEGDCSNTGSSITWSSMATNRKPVTDRSGRDGVAERPVRPGKPGNAGRGKGPQFKATSKVVRGGRLGNLSTPSSVQKLQTALHAKAKAEPGYRFYALYDKMYRQDVLAFAYQCCRANKGAAGVDGQRFEDIEEYGRERCLGELAHCWMPRNW